MTVRCFAVLVALILTILSAFGCGAKPIGSPKEPQPSAEGPSVTVTYHGSTAAPDLAEIKRRWAEEERQAKEERAKFLDALAKDPKPVLDVAAKAVEDYLPRARGDKKARGLEVVVDEHETFGGAKWEVKGRLVERGSSSSGDSGRAAPRADGSWTVEVRADNNKLHAASVILH